MRLFFAVELPPDVKAHLLRLRDEFGRREHGRVKWERPENLHLTIKFLGEVPDPAVALLCDTVKQVSVPGPIRLQAAGWVLFPERGPVRIVAAGVGGDVDRLQRLHGELDSACHAAGYPREARVYKPHLTIGRAKEELSGAIRGTYCPKPSEEGRVPDADTGPTFDVTDFVLTESRLGRDGPVYTTVARFPLNTDSPLP